MLDPLNQPCSHAPTVEEHTRDRNYLGCFAEAGKPCRWATRYDGVVDPPFHSERIETSAFVEPHSGQVNDEAFDAAVIASGLV